MKTRRHDARRHVDSPAFGAASARASASANALTGWPVRLDSVVSTHGYNLGQTVPSTNCFWLWSPLATQPFFVVLSCLRGFSSLGTARPRCQLPDGSQDDRSCLRSAKKVPLTRLLSPTTLEERSRYVLVAD